MYFILRYYKWDFDFFGCIYVEYMYLLYLVFSIFVCEGSCLLVDFFIIY